MPQIKAKKILLTALPIGVKRACFIGFKASFFTAQRINMSDWSS